MTDLRKARFLDMLRRYREGTASPEEARFLEAYYKAFEARPGKPGELSRDQEDALRDRILEGTDEQIALYEKAGRQKHLKRRILRYAAAAAVLICASVFFLYLNRSPQVFTKNTNVQSDKIVPGRDKAVLTLSDGSEVVLDSALGGEIARETGIRVLKPGGGQLTYALPPEAVRPGNPVPAGYHTIRTPRGGQYRVNLPDGTRVWLNAASSLKYPARFTGNDRKVVLTGEAYFEVAENPSKPFRVICNGQETEVLGTRFNVSAYADEPETRTTLLEGSIAVTTGNTTTANTKPETRRVRSADAVAQNLPAGRQGTKLLKPGQEARLDSSGVLRIAAADTGLALAWKNGKFIFDRAPIESIMRKVARWYDVEVVYEGDMRNKDFSGSISRFAEVSDVLQKLALTGIIHFKIEERRIIVMP